MTCGSEPARDSDGSATLDVEFEDAIASRLAPTGVLRCSRKSRQKKGRTLPRRRPRKTKICYRAVITDNLVIPARSIDAMARATSP